MENLKVTVCYHGPVGRGNLCVVSMKDQMGDALLNIMSPSELTGTGGCFGDALADYVEKLDAYISQIQTFRDEVLDSSRAYSEAVEVDEHGNTKKR